MPSINSFDEIVDRTNRGSVKYDFYDYYQVPADAIPLWVADMDFRAPLEVRRAIADNAEYGVYGYTRVTPHYRESVAKWFENQFEWQADPNWIVPSLNVLFAIAMVMRVQTESGDNVLIQEPVYYPFKEVIEYNNRKVVINELYEENGCYKIDFDSFERQIIQNKVKLFLLCSPHNPGGRVWTLDELKHLADILLRHKVFTISDEIHADLVFSGHKHHVFATLGEFVAQNSIICTSPTKTFNLPGLQIANMFIPNDSLRSLVEKEQLRCFYEGPNAPALIATETAYRSCLPWKNELIQYLKKNIDYVIAECKRMGNLLRPMRPEGTYLLWIDCRGLGKNEEQLFRFFAEKAKLWIHRGSTFGLGGDGFIRMNVACSHSVLEQAMKQLALALKSEGYLK